MTPDEQDYVICLERALFEAEARTQFAIDLLQWAPYASRAWQARQVLALAPFPRGARTRRMKERREADPD